MRFRPAPLSVAAFGLAAGLLAPPPAHALSDGFQESLKTILEVGPQGQGNAAASAAWRTLSSADSAAIIPLLEAMNQANPLALNWLRSALETIVDRDVAAGRTPSLDALGGFLFDTSQNPRARRLAFELIRRGAPGAADKLVPGLLNDPAVELRRDAVAWLIGQADASKASGDEAGAALLYEQAVRAARDVDQIKQLTGTLEKMGRKVDLPRHFGFLMEWKVLAPFDNTDRAGFDTVFPPENEIRPDATYPGKSGQVAWRDLASADPYGMVDLNKLFPELAKEVTGYAYTEFDSAEARPAELRLGCKNAWKVWLNGKLLFGRDEYHRGARVDQYQMPVELKKGKNAILVKLCQNEQKETWTVEWQFQLRVCDGTGTAILSQDRSPTPTPTEAEKK